MVYSKTAEVDSVAILLAFLLFIGIPQIVVAQGSWSVPPTTNSIPPNLFLTEGGPRHLFWYNHSGERLVEISTLETARRSKESRPASEDPEGHWGQATNGFQLSLRFEKEVYTNGEPVAATMLVRNVGTVRQQYAFPARVAAAQNGRRLKRKDDIGVTIFGPFSSLHPQTQRRYQEDLKQVYDLTPGEYTFWAVCDKGLPSSGEVKIQIRN
jgi:hypothetical protein